MFRIVYEPAAQQQDAAGKQMQHRDDEDGGENGRNPLQEASLHTQLG